MTKILVVSDVHYELEAHHGVDESGAFDWLAKKIEWAKPEFLVGLGDWGHAWNKSQWDELARLCRVSVIYGNHENLDLLKRVENTDGSRALARDGEIREVGGLRFGFINGVVSAPKPMKQGVPRKSPEEYVKVGDTLAGIDVLCTHESPHMPDYGPWPHKSPGTEAVEEVIKKVRPKLALSGHLAGPFTLGRVVDTLSLRIDSSPSEKHYAILHMPEGVLTVYHDWEPVASVDHLF